MIDVWFTRALGTTVPWQDSSTANRGNRAFSFVAHQNIYSLIAALANGRYMKKVQVLHQPQNNDTASSFFYPGSASTGRPDDSDRGFDKLRHVRATTSAWRADMPSNKQRPELLYRTQFSA
jgi:hypothetical protein